MDRVLRRPDLPPLLTHLVPASLRGSWENRQDVRRLALPLAADAVVLAKLDLGARVKLRAGYASAGLGVAVHPAGRQGTSGATRAARSYGIISQHASGLAPVLRGVGELPGGYHYLAEDWVQGRPLVSGQRLADALEPLLAALTQIHAGYGVQLRRASELWPHFPAQWGAVRDTGVVDDSLYTSLAALLGQDREVRVSWTHGDLAPSNIFTTAHGLVLIDWEQAGERPIMFDGARIHLFAAQPRRTQQLLTDVWDCDRTTAGGYHPSEELALLHARLLSDAPARLTRMTGHPRLDTYRRQLDRQAGLLADLLTTS